MKLHFARTGIQAQAWEGDDYVAAIAEEARRADVPGVTVVDDPDDADRIVLLETCSWNARCYGTELAGHPLIQRHAGRLFVWSYTDEPVPFLNGLYVSLRREWFDSARHAACGYFRDYNTTVPFDDAAFDAARSLAGFHGALSHDVRRALVDLAPGFGPEFAIGTSDRWFDHDPDELADYWTRLRSARFSLCPRGIATSTYRLYESMQASRAPVVLSDDWVPPPGPDWASFALFVPEGELARLPEILRRHEPEWRDRGLRAREAWEAWFGPETRMRRLLEATARLHAADPPPVDPRRWRSEWFYHRYGLSRPQSAVRRVRRWFAARTPSARGRVTRR